MSHESFDDDLLAEEVGVDQDLRPVINATGVLLHTNLGRAPLGEELLAETARILRGYTDLEFDLETGRRGDRNRKVTASLARLVGAQHAVVVNNNAAAVLLVIQALAQGKEVIVSRGELVEIGGQFRIPDVISSAGGRLVEVGATNSTTIEDITRAITPATALLLKAHRSNFTIEGENREVSLPELVALGRRHGVPVYYDLGSGLLDQDSAEEPGIRTALEQGVDLVSFSGDKLLGGPQAGVVVGRADLIATLAKHPLMRALRVGKLTIVGLQALCRAHAGSAVPSPLHAFLRCSSEELQAKAQSLAQAFTAQGLPCSVMADQGSFGGGSLPGAQIPSFAVRLELANDKADSIERLWRELMRGATPVVSILRQGKIVFNVLTLFADEIPLVVQATVQAQARLRGV